MKHYILFLQILLLSLVSSCNGQQKTIANAKELISKEEYRKAIIVLDDIIKNKPSFDSAYFERAYANSMIGNVDKALKDYEYLIRSSANFENEALTERGQLFYSIGEYGKSVEDFTTLTEIKPDNFYAYYARGMARMQLRDYNYKIKDTSALMVIGYDERSFVYDYQSALDDFNLAIKFNPNYPETYVQRGELFAKVEKYQEAIENYNSALKINSNHFDAYFNRGVVLLKLGEVQKSLSDFNEAIRINPENPFPYAHRGSLKAKYLHDKKGACEDFHKAEKFGLPIDDEDKAYCK